MPIAIAGRTGWCFESRGQVPKSLDDNARVLRCQVGHVTRSGIGRDDLHAETRVKPLRIADQSI